MERNSRIWNHGKEDEKNFYALRLEFEFLISLKSSLQKLIAWNCSVAKLIKFSRSRPSKRLFISLIIIHVTAQRLPSVKYFPLPRKLINHETYPLISAEVQRLKQVKYYGIASSITMNKMKRLSIFLSGTFSAGGYRRKVFISISSHFEKPFECFYEWADKSVAWGWNACQSDCMSEVWFELCEWLYVRSFERCVRNVLKIM